MVNPDEAEDVIIAGMGGILISEIIEKAQWLKDKD
ncbi:MAG: tRNA (adenine(22)-N(1))-methyltransferase TrmK, partial [Clostridia bacterium]|nr:tRNA (adenine(22)-N(1))-methyltransferase TrmK [Clostridia bacterium]